MSMGKDMREIKNYFVVFIFIVICIVGVSISQSEMSRWFTEEVLNFIQIITNFATVCAALAAFMTMKATKDTTAGEFILELQQEFSAGYGIEVYTACWNEYAKNKEEDKVENLSKKQIVNYLTFFESLYIMYRKKILSLNELDDLFGRRFFVVVNNKKIQYELGDDNYKYYLNIYKLHSIWQLRRIWKKEELFNKSSEACVNDLSNVLCLKWNKWKTALKEAKKNKNREEIAQYKEKIKGIRSIYNQYKINTFLKNVIY